MPAASAAFLAINTSYPADRRTSPVTSRTNASSSTSRIVSAAVSGSSAPRHRSLASFCVSAVCKLMAVSSTMLYADGLPSPSTTGPQQKPNGMQYLGEEGLARHRALDPYNVHFGNCARKVSPIRFARVGDSDPYFGLVRTVSFGSSAILCVPAGAGKRNEDRSPSANTRPSNTGCFPAATAYTGTDVTRFCGAPCCTIVPLTTEPAPFAANLTALSSSLGSTVPLIQPSRNQSSEFLPS